MSLIGSVSIKPHSSWGILFSLLSPTIKYAYVDLFSHLLMDVCQTQSGLS